MWWNLCALRWLRPTCYRVRNFKPSGSKILYMLFWNGRMKDNSLLLNSDTNSEFLILISKENQSFKVEGKKEYLKQSVRQWKVGILLFLVLMVGSHFGIRFIK